MRTRREPHNNRLHLTALAAPPGYDRVRRFVLADARTAPQVNPVFDGPED